MEVCDSKQNFNFDKEIIDVTGKIEEIENKIKKIGDKSDQNLKVDINDLNVVVVVYEFMFKCNEEKTVLNMDDENKKAVEEKVIKPFLFLLKKITEKFINCESNCYPEDVDGENVLSLLKNIMKWEKNYFFDKNVLQNIEQQYFNIMKDVMIHRKNLLLKAIKNHKIEDGFRKTNLQTTLKEVLSSTVLFSGVFSTEEAHEFLKSFYGNIFDELIDLLNKSYSQKDQKIKINHKDIALNKQTIAYQYETELMGVLFLAISDRIFQIDPHAAYIIGNLFIEKYWHDDENDKNKEYLYVPYLMSFIQNSFSNDIRISDPEYFQKKLKLIKGRIDILNRNAVKRIDRQYINYYRKNINGKYAYSYFGFTPGELFGVKQVEEVNNDKKCNKKIVATDPDNKTAEKFRLNMDYVV